LSSGPCCAVVIAAHTATSIAGGPCCARLDVIPRR
jgi:hypothetical protein